MKITVKILALATLILGFASTSFAQISANATATATATLLVPISIVKTADMNFGTVAASATAGTVVLDYANATTVSPGITKITGTTPSTASFTVTGEGNKLFNISLPREGKITLAGTTGSAVGHNLEVVSITCEQGASGTLDRVTGSLVLKVKGTLNVPANSFAGTYTNLTGLTVTVDYN